MNRLRTRADAARSAASAVAGLAVAAALVVVAPGAPTPTARATPAIPTAPTGPAATSAAAGVGWRWWDGAAHQLTHGLADPPGLNRDDCRPSPDRPVPVILVHGTGLNGGNSWATLGGALAAEGYCVWAPTVGALPGLGAAGGLASLTGASAPQLAAEIDRVRALTGAAEVDLVGHSQGAISASYVAATARTDAVRTVVTLGADPARSGEGPPEFVTDLLGVLSAETAERDAEATLAWLGDEGVPFARGVRYVAVSSDYDELTGPVVAPQVPDFVDLRVVRLQDGCEADRSGHLTVLASPRAVDLVIDALGGPRRGGHGGPGAGAGADAGHGGPGAGAGAGLEVPPPRCVPADQLVGVLAPVPAR